VRLKPDTTGIPPVTSAAAAILAQRSASEATTIFSGTISDLQQQLATRRYVADRGLAVSLFLALRLERPLFLEGEAGVGKTALAGAAAAVLDTDLIRLQCYEGLDVGHALYEWDYTRQLLELRILDATHALTRESAHRELYSESFLIKRPLLQAIDPQRARPAVLLIDEIDRADEEFEGFLLELLAEFQITIPELGTLRARERPLVVLTSNRTREVHDALKRRCLYQWIGYPSFDKELAIVREHAPAASARLAERVTAMVQEMRTGELYKKPGVSETIDWVSALVALEHDTLDADAVDETLGVVLKAKEDVEALRGRRAAEILDRAVARTTRAS
jgi:MoxR-like ATPase